MYNQESELEKKKQKNNIMEKFLEEYNQMKKDKEELEERLEKSQLNYNTEVQNEKEKQKKLQQEITKLTKSMKELKNELQSYEQKLTKKENECIELKKRIDTKVGIDDKTKDRDTNIFMKFLGRKPVSTNSQDQKLVTILNHFENQKEKLEKENIYWKKECDGLREAVLEQRGENNKLSDDEKNKSRFFEKVKEELMNQVSSLQEEKERLLEINLRFTKNYDILQKEHKSLLFNHQEIKELYKQLRIDYQNVVFKQQDQHLQSQRAQHEKNINYSNQTNNNYNTFNQQQYQDENVNTLNHDKQYLHNNQQQLFTLPTPQEQHPSQNGLTKIKSRTPETIEDDYQNQNNIMTKKLSDHQLYGDSSNNPTTQQIQEILAAKQDIISQLCEIYSIEDEDELVQCAQKTELVMQAIPKMESLLQHISEIVFGNNNNQASESKKEKNIERIIPILQKWKVEVKLIDQFVLFKDKLCESLSIKGENSTDRDILQQVEILKSQISQTQSTSTSIQTIEIKQQKQVLEFMKLFEIGEDDNVQTKISQIFLQLNDIQRFIKITKKLLELDEDMRAEACLTYILKLLEKMKMNKYNDPDLIMKIQKILKVDDPVQILSKIENLQKGNKLSTLTNSQNTLKKIQL